MASSRVTHQLKKFNCCSENSVDLWFIIKDVRGVFLQGKKKKREWSSAKWQEEQHKFILVRNKLILKMYLIVPTLSMNLDSLTSATKEILSGPWDVRAKQYNHFWMKYQQKIFLKIWVCFFLIIQITEPLFTVPKAILPPRLPGVSQSFEVDQPSSSPDCYQAKVCFKNANWDDCNSYTEKTQQ